jgi:PAS domain S-box-containing protein
MSGNQTHILLVEDESAHAELISRAFYDNQKEFRLAVAATINEARSYLEASNPDLVIVDFLLPDGKGTDLLTVEKETSPYPIVMMTAYGDENLAVEAMKAGALDYVVKSESIFSDMPHIAERALREWNHIIQRKQAENALKEREAMLRAVMTASPVGICLELDQVIKWHNEGLSRILGYANGSLKGKKVRDFYTEEDEFNRTKNQLLSEINKKGIGQVETKWLTENGEIIDCYLQSTLLDPPRASNGLITTITDITDRNKLQQRLIEAQKMEAVGTLAGGIAHDFNNILAAIMGNAEMGMFEEISDSTKHNLDQILMASHRAKDLVKQILTYSRKSEPIKKPFRITPIVHETIKMVRATIPSTIEIQSELESSTGVILADLTQINQVLLNLCTNSAQAMAGKGGILTVGLFDVNLDSDNVVLYPNADPGAYVKLMVKDTGTGIAPADIERIFDPYFTTKEAGKGTGMGLAVAYGIIKSHGGHVKVYSELGDGTTFEVLFPRIESETISDDKKIDSPPMGNEKILFIDDEDFLVDLAKRMLEKLGYQVVVKQSPMEALEMFKDQPDEFDLVISDMTMPGLTGVELAKQIIAIRSDIPFILCSGYNEHVSAEKIKGFGIKEFLMKPLEIKVLAKTIRRALEK